MYKQFGDLDQHPLHMKSHMLKCLQWIQVHSDDLRSYLTAAQTFYWCMASPPQFLTPEPLHGWCKKIWDHGVQWVINIVRAGELDFCFSVLQPSVTGRTQHDVQRYLIAVIAGSAPPGVVIAIHALIDFCYLVQAPKLDNNDCSTLLSSLCTFHKHKSHVIKVVG
ncbi:hypothetical protein V8E55_009525 [Tylopilus felleus]